MFNISQSGLEQDASKWLTQIGSSINLSPSLGFQASNLPDGRLKVTNVGNIAWAGGLVARKLQVPQLTGAGSSPTLPAFAMFSTYVTIPSTALYNLARLETDLIVVFNAAPSAATTVNNKANGSTQLNFDTGNFMVDASSGAAAWSDIGRGPGKVTPDVEHYLAIKYAYDLANAKVSIQSITWDSVVYTVPTSLQNVSFQPSNWGQVAAIQKQTEIYKPGSVDVIYRASTLQWSDTQF